MLDESRDRWCWKYMRPGNIRITFGYRWKGKSALLWSQQSHKALSVWEDEPVNNEGTNRLQTQRPLSGVVCLMVVTSNAIWVMLVCTHRRDSMVVADGLVPIWRQDICNHRDGECLSARPRNITTLWDCRQIPAILLNNVDKENVFKIIRSHRKNL